MRFYQRENFKTNFIMTLVPLCIFSASSDLKKVNTHTKGQIISEQICGVLKFSKKQRNFARISVLAKVIYTKYSKHCPYTVAHTIECVCSKINHGLNHGFTMRKNLPKTLDQLIFCKYTLVFGKCSQIY